MDTNKIDDIITSLALETASNPQTRTETFKNLGQNLSLINDAKELKRLIHLYWNTIIENKDKWQGKLFIPDYYRRNKEKFVYQDVWYSIRDAWAWYMLYPNDAKEWFKITEEGDILFGDTAPKPRLMEKENKVIATKNEVGAYSYETKKPLLSHRIKSGFTMEAAHVIFEYLTFGYFEFIPKKPKKDDVSESDDLEGLSDEALKKLKSKAKALTGKAGEKPSVKGKSKALPPSEKQIASDARSAKKPQTAKPLDKDAKASKSEAKEVKKIQDKPLVKKTLKKK